MYETRRDKLLSTAQFARRVALNILIGAALAAFALLVGVLGYHFIAHLPWVDAVLNASMILAGMGEVDPLRTTGGKLFASAYALFSGLVFIGIFAVVVGPFAHRLMHRFHIDDSEGNAKPRG
jgi:hypothetical protein